ncbi:thioredoxin domain-containing protein [Halomonas denitrificans]|nr:thioredoxin domain-containing protein [Halomonas denitrificans]
MPNRLHGASSPYLRQHSEQPVDWYPWGDEALREARDSDRPILLSIGYAACHWCHVMAHESFDDPEVAERMNAWFVNVKVDREARPDLDRTYQLAHQLLSGQGGGWPLTAFLDPADLAPFVAGTYFPPEARHGLIGFGELLERVHRAWLEQRDTLKAQNRRVIDALGLLVARSSDGEADAPAPDDHLIGQLEAREDTRHGGFGDAPKFPQPPLLAWLAERGIEDPSAERMLLDALRAIVRNGLADQLGGGFFRYCVDAAWEIPHFEKMLADNAQLLDLLAAAAARWSDPELADAATRTAEFLARDLALDGGGFATSLDADSAVPEAHQDSDTPLEAGQVRVEEGAHYRWRPDDLDGVLDGPIRELAEARFGLDGPSNLPGRFWHPVQARSIAELAEAGRDAASTLALLDRARTRMLEARCRRPMPARDDQLRAGTNGLAAAALARAGRYLDREDWIDRADRTLTRVVSELLDAEPPAAVLAEGRAEHPLLLDDLAALLDASIALLDARFDPERLDLAERLADWIERDHFEPHTGRFGLIAHDRPTVLMRPRADVDEAIPAGAATAVLGWVALAHRTGDAERLARARQAADAVRAAVQESPAAHATWLRAQRRLDGHRPLIVVGGPGREPDDWVRRLVRRVDRDVLRVPPGLDDLPATLQAATSAEGTSAWICVGARCLAPLDDLDAVEEALDRESAAGTA